MPTFLERVGRSLTRKKPEPIDPTRESVATALEGFEPISPSDAAGYQPLRSPPPFEKSQSVFSSLLRSKSPGRNEGNANSLAIGDRAPHLSLHIPELKQGATLPREQFVIAFESPKDSKYTEEVIAGRRLSSSETLLLIQQTSAVLLEKGMIVSFLFYNIFVDSLSRLGFPRYF